MEATYQWGIDLINWMQQASPTLDIPFTLLTITGDQEFYMLVLPLLIWSIDQKIGLRLTVFFLISGFLNSVAKAIAAAPRPFQYDPSVKAIVDATGGGMPSGHTQNALFVWGYLYKWFESRWFRVLAIALIILVPLSRVYLGVHFPTDLVGGYIVGLILLVFILRFEDLLVSWVSGLHFGIQLLASIACPLLMLLLIPNPLANEVVICATLMGGAIGLSFKQRYLKFHIAPSWMKRGLSYVLGILVFFMIYLGLKLLFTGLEPTSLFRFIRYALIGFYTVFIAPWMFVKLRLAST